MDSSPAQASPQIVSNLVSEMTDKAHINQDVKVLKGLVATPESSEVDDIKVQMQDLKMMDKARFDLAGEQLSQTADFSASSGLEYSPLGMVPASSEAATSLATQIKICGEKVKDLELKKADVEASIGAAVQELLELKDKYRTLVGKEWTIGGNGAVPRAAKSVPEKLNEKPRKQPKKKLEKKKEAEDAATGGKKKQTRLCLEAEKEKDLANWYTQLVTKSEMLSYYDVGGCYVIRPWGYAIWELIVQFLDREMKKIGVENCIFPMLITQQALEKEAAHLKGFKPEVAWVTKTGNSTLKVPLAIRPTSETGMYPSYADWIQSHNDLPLKCSQFNTVMRWEFKDTMPFIRSREFCWQEGHTVFATETEAKDEVAYVLDKIYTRLYEELLAVPVIKGRKTINETFPGAIFTNTIEAFIPTSGRGIQAATAHCLGQKFAEMFGISFQDPVTGETKKAFQNSWGVTARTIGIMSMIHGGNKGLVLPPKVAPKQVVIVPCGITNNKEEMAALMATCRDYETVLEDAGIRVKLDDRDYYSPGWKFNHWELKGVPIRLEIGPNDVKKEEYVVFRRDTSEKSENQPKASVVENVKKLLDDIQRSLLVEATRKRDECMADVEDFDKFIIALDNKKMILAPFCGAKDCEENIKTDSKKADEKKSKGPSMGAKSLCIPFEQRPLEPGTKCIHCTNEAKQCCFFGRSY